MCIIFFNYMQIYNIILYIPLFFGLINFFWSKNLPCLQKTNILVAANHLRRLPVLQLRTCAFCSTAMHFKEHLVSPGTMTFRGCHGELLGDLMKQCWNFMGLNGFLCSNLMCLTLFNCLKDIYIYINK